MAFIGVDFGNKSSCVAVYREETGIEIILNDHGNHVTPSCLTFTNEGRLYGEEALARSSTHSDSVVYDIKRLLGKKYVTVFDNIEKWPFTVINSDGDPMVKLFCDGLERRLSPEEIAGMLLHALRVSTESQLGAKVDGVVLSVPAHATDSQRQATVRAAALAGLRVIRLINAPTAAAVAATVTTTRKSEEKMLVYDIGGHALDVTILTVDSRANYLVKATAVAFIGGDDFDDRLAQYLADEFQKATGLVLDGDHIAFQRLKIAAEKAKNSLSFVTEVEVCIESIRCGINLELKVSRAQFENVAADLFARSLEPVQKALNDARLDASSVNSVVLIGGCSRVPRIRKKLKEMFGNKINSSLNPDEAVARGLALSAAGLHFKIKDICPRAFSVAAKGGLAAVLIPRMSQYPIQRGRAFSSCAEGAVRIRVMEGDRPRIIDNDEIGFYELKDFYAKKLHLLFSLNDNGILTITATDNKRNAIQLVRADLIVAEEKFNRMSAAVERYKFEDEELKVRALTRNQLETNAIDLKTSIKEELNAGRLNSEEASTVLKAVTRTLQWLKSASSVSATNDELIQYQCELLQVSAPVFRAKSLLSNNAKGSLLLPLTFGDPIKRDNAVRQLLEMGKDLSDDLDDLQTPSSSESSSTQNLNEPFDFMRDEIASQVVNIEGDEIDSDVLLQQQSSMPCLTVDNVAIEDIGNFGSHLDEASWHG